MPFGLAPAVAAGASTGPLAPIAIPISILLSALGLRRLFGGGGEPEGPQPYGVGEWTIKPGDPWYGQPIDPHTGLHQSIVDQIWNMAPPEGLPASMLASNPNLGIPNWSALRLQRMAWELGGWNNLVDVLKSEPNVGNLPDWLTSRMSWNLNPLVDGTQGGNVYDMSDWLTFSTTVFGLPWGIVNGELGQIPEGQQPDYVDPATGMPVFSTTVEEPMPQEPTGTPAATEPTFPPAPPPSDREPEVPSRDEGRLPRFSTTVTAPMPTTPTPLPVEPPMPEPVPTPPVIPPVLSPPNLPEPTFPGPPTAEPPLIPPPPAAGAPSVPSPRLPDFGPLAGLPMGGGPAIPPSFPSIGGGQPYQSLFGLPIPQPKFIPSLAQMIGGR